MGNSWVEIIDLNNTQSLIVLLIIKKNVKNVVNVDVFIFELILLQQESKYPSMKWMLMWWKCMSRTPEPTLNKSFSHLRNYAKM